MFGYETVKDAADGCVSLKNFSVICLLAEDRQNRFLLSENIDNQAFTVKSASSIAADDCVINSSTNVSDEVYSVQSKNPSKRSVSVKYCPSAIYRVAENICDTLCITICVLKSVYHAVVRHARKIIENMKGIQCECKVYTLCLLRL